METSDELSKGWRWRYLASGDTVVKRPLFVLHGSYAEGLEYLIHIIEQQPGVFEIRWDGGHNGPILATCATLDEAKATCLSIARLAV
jgi:hypothetical protein